MGWEPGAQLELAPLVRNLFFLRQKTAYEFTVWLEFRRVLFRSWTATGVAELAPRRRCRRGSSSATPVAVHRRDCPRQRGVGVRSEERRVGKERGRSRWQGGATAARRGRTALAPARTGVALGGDGLGARRAARACAACAQPFFFEAEDGIRVHCVAGVQTCALPILARSRCGPTRASSALPTRVEFGHTGCGPSTRLPAATRRGC